MAHTLTFAEAELVMLARFLREHAALLQDLADKCDRLDLMHQANQAREDADQAHDFAMRFEAIAMTKGAQA